MHVVAVDSVFFAFALFRSSIARTSLLPEKPIFFAFRLFQFFRSASAAHHKSNARIYKCRSLFSLASISIFGSVLFVLHSVVAQSMFSTFIVV